MTHQVSEFTAQESEQTWKQKYLKLQNELLQARIEQINLKRINRGLEETLKLAMNQTSQPQTNRTSTQKINLTWKEKYQREVEKNIENQRYIKVLETRRNTLSVNKSNKKRQSSTKTNLTTGYNKTRSTYTPLILHEATDTMNRNSSVKKMHGFMERLMKEKYTISEFGLNNYFQDYQIERPMKMRQLCVKDDPIEKLFGSVKAVTKENRVLETEQEEIRLKGRSSLHSNHALQRTVNLKTIENSLNRKLTLTPHMR